MSKEQVEDEVQYWTVCLATIVVSCALFLGVTTWLLQG